MPDRERPLSPERTCRELRYDSPPDPERRDHPNQASGPTPDGVKRRLVDQGLWFNAGVIVVPARFSCCMTLDICDTGTAKFDR